MEKQGGSSREKLAQRELEEGGKAGGGLEVRSKKRNCGIRQAVQWFRALSVLAEDWISAPSSHMMVTHNHP